MSMILWSSLSYPVLASALALNVASLALFLFHDLPLSLYAEEPAAFFVFTAVSSALIVGMALCRTFLRLRVQAAIWLFLFLILTYQFGAHTGERLFLMLAFLSVLALRETYPLNLIVCLVSVAAAGAALFLSLWSSTSAATDALASTAVFAVPLGFAAAGLCVLAYYRTGMRRFGAENEDLKAIMRKLAEAQLGYLEFARSAEERSSTNERNRLSAELHDTIGYTFTNLEMILEAGMDLMDTDRAKLRDLLETGLGQVRHSMKETRRTLYLIRESSDAPRFFVAVQRLGDVFCKTTGMQVRIDYGDFPAQCGSEAESAFYHFIQEGLVNAFSHGKATQVWVSFSVEAESLRVTLLDNGIGTPDVEEGIGIRGMRERFGRLAGTLSIDSPRDGFRITATVPING